MSEHDAYRTFNLSNFLGLQNAGDATRLPATSFKNCNNIVLDTLGNIQRRQGYTFVRADIVDFYTTRNRQDLYEINSLGKIFHNEVEIGAVSPTTYQWCDFGEYIYLLSPQAAYYIKQNIICEWGRDDVSTSVSIQGGGQLKAGRYKVAIFDNEKQLILEISELILQNDQQIVVSGITNSERVLVSPHNATHFIDFNTAPMVVISNPSDFETRPLFRMDGVYFPVDRRAVSLTWFQSSIWLLFHIKDHSLLVPSRPAQYNLYDYDSPENLVISGTVRCIVSDRQALYIATSDFIYGFNGERLETLFEFGVPQADNPQALFSYLPDGRVCLFSVRGPIILPNNILSQQVYSRPFDGLLAASVIDEVGGSLRGIFIGNFSNNSFNRER